MFTHERAINAFASAVVDFGRASLNVITSAAVAYLSTPEDETAAVTTAKLRSIVEEQLGLRTATVYRYVRLGFELAKRISDDDDQETNEHVAASRSPAVAAEVLVKWLADKSISSADALAELVGVYRRPAPRVAANVPAEEGEEGEEAGASRAPSRRPLPQDDRTPLEIASEVIDGIDDLEVLYAIRSVVNERIAELEATKKRKTHRKGRTHSPRDGERAHA